MRTSSSLNLVGGDGLGLPSSPCSCLVPLLVPSTHVPQGEWPQHRGEGVAVNVKACFLERQDWSHIV